MKRFFFNVGSERDRRVTPIDGDFDLHFHNSLQLEHGEGSDPLEREGKAEEGKAGESKGEFESVPVHLFYKCIWHGGSMVDAWFNAVAAQVGQVILSLPTSYAMMGFKLGIFFHLLYTIIGIWTCYLIARLYVEFRHREEKKGRNFKNHVIQFAEVIGAMVGPVSKRMVQFFNIMSMISVSTIQIIACASNAYYVSDRLNKQQWALIFGGIAMFTILLPTLHNFRILSFFGVLTTTYTAWYMFIAALKHGQQDGITHSNPRSFVEVFTGTTNILFATGGHSITMEIMHAMWKPRQYKAVYILNCIYVISITMPHSLALLWAFGDDLLSQSNALALLPPSNARTTALIFMIVHQAIAYGIFMVPLFSMWEKIWGLHGAWYPVKVVHRLPLAGMTWFLALLLPFFGPFNSLVGAAIMSFNSFLIPAAAYIYIFWTPESRQNAAEKVWKYLPGWKGFVVINVAVLAVIGSLGAGLGTYASITMIKRQLHTFGFFDACYEC